MKRLIAVVVAATVLLVAPAGAAKNPLKLVSQENVNERLLQLEFSTPAMAEGAAAARILLPPGYERSKREYPVIYLLHGAGYDEKGWSEEGRVEGIIGSRKVIVVMPNGGGNGYYTDWFNGGDFGPPAYETFHIGQLLPYVDEHFRTRDERGGRVVAGFSMSGFGAMSYAARHPDLFSGAFSFSGAIDTNFAPFQPIGESSSLADGGQYAAIWGTRAEQEVRWRAKNPWDLATNLEGMTLQIYTGNGSPGGPFSTDPGLDIVELGVNLMSHSMHDRLDELGIPHLFNDYGPGTHDWPYYSRDLEWSLPAMMSTFKKPPAPPREFTFRAVEPSYSAYRYDVKFKRPVLEFSELTAKANGKRFQLLGSGTARIKTPPLKPRTRYAVEVRGAGGTQDRSLRTDGKGRLSLRVSLGPPNPAQQYTAEAQAEGGTAVRQATVRITPR